MEICITVEYDEISLRGGVGDCKLGWVLSHHVATLFSPPLLCRQRVVKSAVLVCLGLSHLLSVFLDWLCE